MLVPHKIDVSDYLVTALKFREKTVASSLTDEMLNSAKNDGRP
jgi:hypothetical protein